jgi:glycosyltransferase involved in cell wall biosynthesis
MRDLFSSFFMAEQSGVGAQAVHEFFNGLDVIVLPRTLITEEAVDEAIIPFFQTAQMYGTKVVYEVDDDFTNKHRMVITDYTMQRVASLCDAVTVTTPYLAQTMEEELGIPAYVLPNYLEPALWQDGDYKRNLPSDKVVIWLSGSQTHYEDWKVLDGIFPALLQKHPEAVLVICGFHPDYLKTVEGVVLMDGVDYRIYSQLVRQVDVVLAPVDPNDGFNMGKSPIKAVEGMGAVRRVGSVPMGAAVIATDNPIYRLAVRDGIDGVLVQEHTPQAWFDALDKVLSDARFRRSLQTNAYNTVWKKGKWDISRNWKRWADAYTSIAALPKRELKQVAVVGEGVI